MNITLGKGKHKKVSFASYRSPKSVKSLKKKKSPLHLLSSLSWSNDPSMVHGRLSRPRSGPRDNQKKPKTKVNCSAAAERKRERVAEWIDLLVEGKRERERRESSWWVNSTVVVNHLCLTTTEALLPFPKRFDFEVPPPPFLVSKIKKLELTLLLVWFGLVNSGSGRWFPNVQIR